MDHFRPCITVGLHLAQAVIELRRIGVSVLPLFSEQFKQQLLAVAEMQCCPFRQARTMIGEGANRCRATIVMRAPGFLGET